MTADLTAEVLEEIQEIEEHGGEEEGRRREKLELTFASSSRWVPLLFFQILWSTCI